MGRSFFLGALTGAIGLIAIVAIAAMVFLSRGVDGSVGEAASLERAEFSGLYTPERIASGRVQIALEDPRVIQRFVTGGIFGNKASRIAGLHMFSRDEAVTQDIRAKTERVEVAPGTWLVRFPIVNAAFFETSEGVVVVDTGMAAAGPVLIEHIREVTDAPIAAIIITHGHVDHLTGLWAFEAAGELPARIIGHENIPARIERYGELRGSIAKYMSQPFDEVPSGLDALILPNETFSDRMELEIGGETFVLQHRLGETDDQLFVWVPSRKAVVTADYYQAFVPNLGNGKRVQRFGADWIDALREMADLEPEMMLPMHGPEVVGLAEIMSQLTETADALEHIQTETRNGLNAGLRKDEVIDNITWPERFAQNPYLENYYVSPQDIAKMYIKQWTGWWDDQPAHWTPATLEAQSRHIVKLAGGMESFLESGRQVMESDIVLASHMADWAFYAEPDNREAQDFAVDVYRIRLLDPAVPEQEALTYFDHIALIRGLQSERGN
ncbi:MAG: alkyl sulfatase dimerization domain-containing protein [Hyphomonadaceae bacterium]